MKYHVARDGQQVGTFYAYEIRDRLLRGELRASDLYWREGMADWQPISTSEDFEDVLNPNREGAATAAASSPVEAEAFWPEKPGAATASAAAAPLATLQQRLSAYLIDFACVAVCFVLVSTGQEMLETSPESKSRAESLMSMGGIGALFLLIINASMLASFGQTIGKRIVGIRVANYSDKGNPGFLRAVLLRWVCNGMVALIPIIGPIYAILDVCFILRPDRRCLHDYLAETCVVQGSLRKQK